MRRKKAVVPLIAIASSIAPPGRTQAAAMRAGSRTVGGAPRLFVDPAAPFGDPKQVCPPALLMRTEYLPSRSAETGGMSCRRERESSILKDPGFSYKVSSGRCKGRAAGYVSAVLYLEKLNDLLVETQTRLRIHGEVPR